MALVYYTDFANGNDSNGGSSESHTADASGTGGVTDGTTTIDLSADTPDLSGVSAGDVIRINGESNGIRSTDLFEIASANDGADTVTVTGNTPGSASSLTWAIGGAFKKAGRASVAVEAGDKVWMQGGTDYDETATIGIAGSFTTMIVFEGYTTTPGDGGSATIDGGSSRANGFVGSGGGGSFNRFENLIFENHTGTGCSIPNADHFNYTNCEFNSNGTDGAKSDNVGCWVSCSATGNSAKGIMGDNGNVFIGCTTIGNATDGITGGNGSVAYNCVSSSDADRGILMTGGNVGVGAAFNCTVDGDGKDTTEGIKSGNANYPFAVVNCICYDCATGILSAVANGPAQVGSNNLVNSNTADYSNWGPTGTDVTGAPAFTDEGSQDYTLGSGSAAINAGADNSGSSSPGMDIGAHQSADAGGGGGIIKMAGDGGGMVG